MKIGQEQEKPKPAELNESVVQEKIRQHGAKLQDTNQQIEAIQKQMQAGQQKLNLLVDQNKLLIGAIKGLQELLPKGPDEAHKANDQGKDGKDVPSTDDPKPSGDEEPGKGSGEDSGGTE